MRTLGKIIIGIFFSLLFSLFIFFSSLNFLLLNDKYLFYVFDKHKVYEKVPHALSASLPNDPNLSGEEGKAYASIIGSIPPATIEKIIKENLTTTLSYIHGNTNDIVISLPSNELGLGPTNISWSLSKNATPDAKNSLNIIHGIWVKMLILWLIVLLALVGMFYLYGKISKNRLAGNRLLITNGLYLFLSSLLLAVLSAPLANSFPSKLEPSQALIRIFISSLIPEIAMLLTIFGLIILVAGLYLRRVQRRREKVQAFSLNPQPISPSKNN